MLDFGNFNRVFPLSFILYALGFLLRCFCFLRFSGEKSEENRSVLDDFCEKTDGKSVVNDEEKYKIEEKEISKLEYEVENVYNASSTSKYEFFAGNTVYSFIEEPQSMNFKVQEIFVLPHDKCLIRKNSLEKNDTSFEVVFPGISEDFDANCGDLGEEEVLKQRKTECSVLSLCFEGEDGVFEKEKGIDEKQEVLEIVKINDQEHYGVFGKEEILDQPEEVLGKEENVDEEQNRVFRNEDIIDQEQDGPFKKEEILNQEKDEIFEEDDTIIDQKDRNLENTELCDEVHSSTAISNSNDFWASIYLYDDILGSNNEYFDSDFDDENSAKALEPETLISLVDLRVDYDEDSPSTMENFLNNQQNSELVDDISMKFEHEHVDSSYIELDPQSICSSNDVEEHQAKNVTSNYEEDEIDKEGSNNDELDEQTRASDMLVMEQKELIRQMKKEIRQLNICGLPTILEESESPRVKEDLRPFKIDQRIGHKHRLQEIQTFYKKHLDKVKKLDILSHQTMYAIGLLELKNNQKVGLKKKEQVNHQNNWSNKLRKQETEAVKKVKRELQGDMELAYVGQLCSSWEMLKWQHKKAEELKADDPDGFHHYNQAAAEFQKFQVLLQRFTEDEPFQQTPRIQHYLKTRCALPSLLQVPLVKDDPKTEWRKNGEDVISIKMLTNIIGASMSTFWEFVHADKEDVYVIPVIGICGVQPILQHPSDVDLLTQIRSNLQKKEKRLKDLVRSGNCLVRKFQKQQDQRLSHEMLVAQVELRLVSRVLAMSKLTTEQLLWCHKKLNKLDIIDRKIYLEYSFLLFPC